MISGAVNYLAPLGQAWLRERFGLRAMPSYLTSHLIAGARRIEVHGPRTTHYYPRDYIQGDEIAAHLRFALRHEPLDLGLLTAAFRVMPDSVIVDWLRAEPGSAFARRSWFLYEFLTGRILDLPDATTGKLVPVLDPAKHVTGAPRTAARHRVIDNLLGTPRLCPTIRRTAHVQAGIAAGFDAEIRALVRPFDPTLIARATSYLYTKETRSSFAIEGEKPSATRTERFVAALRAAPRFDPTDPAAIVALQNAIVDPRYAATVWRDFQNFVGETTVDLDEQVHYICPRPGDVPSLMQGWMDLIARMLADRVEPIAAAAVAAFAFVLIHPFEDGNGRIHRFIIHHVLSRTGFTPDGMIFPVSAAILRNQRAYEATLELFSQPLLSLIEWDWTAAREIDVKSDTADHYRFFDATPFAEYLFDQIGETIRTDLPAELNFLVSFDAAMAGLRAVVDMPDRRAGLLIRLLMQNDFKLSRAKRDHFPELTDPELAAIEAAVQAAATSGMAAGAQTPEA